MEYNKVKQIEVMVDLETTGTKPGCHILSIGACTFGHDASFPKHFFQDFATKEDSRFESNRDTLIWWSARPQHIKEEVFKGTEKIEVALEGFSKFLGTLPSFRIWGNSASFDLKILEKAYEICNLAVPWTYRQEMCYRTLKNLYPQIKFKAPSKAHIALEDAVAQANHADEILQYKAAVEGQQAPDIFN